MKRKRKASFSGLFCSNC